ncbi:NADPH-dependent F420 reductase [Paractinoplanes globisporus]|uniref:NADPH-dependent F420 reductase n=1 Tax=Paractinoplanes globisporus TaxID=113565 RepID=A0ABW6W6E8_9ACTN|nr:NAD(P)-binding domain-containing protein [Actinoplanes globisporus]
MSRIAVLGSGHTGPIVARMAVETGHQVSISASGDPRRIALIAQVLAPGAEARWAADAVRDADIVVLAIPMHAFASLDPSLFAGKLVVDIMNYWPPNDGVLEMFENTGRGSSEVVAERLAGATVVKTLNHIGYHDMDERRLPAGAPGRLALGVAGDDPEAVDTVADLIDSFGFDPVRFSSLSAGRGFEPGHPVFGALLTRDQFLSELDLLAED